MTSARAPRSVRDFRREQELGRSTVKSFAKSAAGRVGAAEGRRAIREIFLAETLQDLPSPEYSRIELGDERTLDVGIWRRKGRHATAPFTRRIRADDEWSSWADVKEIAPKRAKWRVALLGESVAKRLPLRSAVQSGEGLVGDAPIPIRPEER